MQVVVEEYRQEYVGRAIDFYVNNHENVSAWYGEHGDLMYVLPSIQECVDYYDAYGWGQSTWS